VKRTVVIRVGPVEQSRRELKGELAAIVRGEPVGSRREIWFPNLAQLAAVLTESRLELLRLIHEKHPASVARLARSAGCAKKSIEADLQALADVGLVKLVVAGRLVRPLAQYDRIQLAGDIAVGRAAA
jgi:predicted transcriptional regulator